VTVKELIKHLESLGDDARDVPIFYEAYERVTAVTRVSDVVDGAWYGRGLMVTIG
jgi:hypothetical protein